MDQVFEAEQQHLTETYAALERIERTATERLEANLAEARAFKNQMAAEITPDFVDDDNTLETLASIAVYNNVIDDYNIATRIEEQRLEKVRLLLKKPYFAKVCVSFPSREGIREVYLGAVGMLDERNETLVVDWRAPIAETYYNQENGRTSYWANDRLVEADLLLRRQFDIEGAVLRSYFDTTVAIEDPLLLASLAQTRTASLRAITATIQKEQNQVIRHDDVPALLVRGIAGSGKTSVLLQRIAFLLFRQRKCLSARQVYLITPNPVFQAYVRNVLPELGEQNPNALTWADLVAKIGPGDRALGDDTPVETLERIDAGVGSLVLDVNDMREIMAGEYRLLSPEQIWKVVARYLKKLAPGPRLCNLVEEDLLEKLEARVASLGSSAAVREAVLLLDDDEKERVLGHPLDQSDEEDVAECARAYIADLAEASFAQVEAAGWLRLDRIGMRLLNQPSLSGLEWLYLRMALAGKVDIDARLVVIDEVQDYSIPQLMTLARYFSRAHFLMLGDENQAIEEGTASFAQVRSLFEKVRGKVDELELMTSYRSSPEITEFFSRLMTSEERLRTTSVRPAGTPVRVVACPSEEAYVAELAGAVEAARAQGGLTAVIARGRRSARRVDALLRRHMGQAAPVVMEGCDSLPNAGVVLIDLKLAKGLEFDQVIVADATAEEYPDTALGRHRLYVAASRATQSLTVVANGQLTPLIEQA